MMTARLTIKQLDEWRGESEHVDLLLEYISNLQWQLAKLVSHSFVYLDDDGLHYGGDGNHDEAMAILLVIGTSGLLDEDGILLHK